MTRDKTYNLLIEELKARGATFRPADVWGWLAACWPTESDIAELADDFILATEGS